MSTGRLREEKHERVHSFSRAFVLEYPVRAVQSSYFLSAGRGWVHYGCACRNKNFCEFYATQKLAGAIALYTKLELGYDPLINSTHCPVCEVEWIFQPNKQHIMN